MPKKKQSTALIPSGNAKFGRALVSEAERANQEKLQKRVIGTVQELLSQIKRQGDQIKTHKSAIRIMERRVVALKAGKFTLDELGSITFTEPALGKECCYVTTCNQCGYPKTVIAKI